MDMDEVANIPVAELIEKVTTFSKGTVVNPQKTVELLKKVAQESYGIKDSFKEPLDLILTNTYENIKYFQGKIQSIDKVIGKEYQRSLNLNSGYFASLCRGYYRGNWEHYKLPGGKEPCFLCRTHLE